MSSKKCNPCDPSIRVYNRNKESLVERQADKKNQIKIKVTSYIRGQSKNEFLDDCQRRGNTESVIIRDIIRLHYDLMAKFPSLRGKEYRDILAYLTE